MMKERRCKNNVKVKSRGVHYDYCVKYHHTVTEADCRKCGEQKEEKKQD